MACKPINVGERPNDGNGDTVRNAFIKTNENFKELFDKYDELLFLNSFMTEESQWQRPADWLQLDIPSDNQEKFIALYAIRNNPYNYCAFIVQGNYTVDWGDGTVENYSSGTKAEHKYDFNNSLFVDTLTSLGFKQAIITVTPQSGNNLTSINLGVKHSFFDGKTVLVEAGFLDFVVVGQYLTSFKVTQTANLTPSTFTASTTLNSGETLYSLPYQSDSSGSVVNTDISFNLLYQFYIGKNALSTITENFHFCSNLRRIERLELTNSFAINSFQGCDKLETVKNFKMISCKSAYRMFDTCIGLKYIEAEKISVKDCDWMFTGCSSLKYVKINDFSDTVFCNRLFYQCVALNRVCIYNANSVITFDQAFEGCDSLLTVTISNTEDLVDMDEMFDQCHSLTKVKFTNTPSLVSANYAFNDCSSLKEVTGLNFKSVKEMQYIFQYCYSLQSFIFNSENNTYPIDAEGSFFDCRSLKNVVISSNTTFSTALSLFENCFSLKTLNEIKLPSNSTGAFSKTEIVSTDNIDTSGVTNGTSLFRECNSLATVTNLNFDSLQNASNMFLGCLNLIEVGSINLTNTTTATSLFYDCHNLTRSRVFGIKVSHSYENCYLLSGTALNEIFTNLGTAVGSPKVINLTNVLGTADVEFDPTIATAKNWTVTY